MIIQEVAIRVCNHKNGCSVQHAQDWMKARKQTDLSYIPKLLLFLSDTEISLYISYCTIKHCVAYHCCEIISLYYPLSLTYKMWQ